MAVVASRSIGERVRPGSSKRVCRGVLEGEDDLEQRVPREAALDVHLFDEPLERQALALVRGEGVRAHPLEEDGEIRIAGKVGTQHQGVDEEPDQSFGLGPVAIGDGRADQDVFLLAE